MNTDQTTSMVRSVLKVAGGILLAHGASKAAAVVNGEDSVGLVVTIVGFVWSHFSNSDNSIAKKADAIADKAPPVGSVTGMVLILGMLSLAAVGCKSTFAPGGAYSGSTVATNAATGAVSTNTMAAADPGLFAADTAYQLAYDLVDGVFLFEYQHRAQLLALSPKVKQVLDSIRPTVVDIDHRWALARQAYQSSPTPAGLSTLQSILAEIQKLVPTVQAALTPALTTATATTTP